MTKLVGMLGKVASAGVPALATALVASVVISPSASAGEADANDR